MKIEYKKNKDFYVSLYKIKSKKKKKELYLIYFKEMKKLALKGCLNSQFDLAQHYEKDGFFGKKNPYFNNFKRFYWYYKSALNGYAESYNNLADIIERGDGCKLNLKKAFLFYLKAKDLGSELGKENYLIMKKDFEKGGIYYAK